VKFGGASLCCATAGAAAHTAPAKIPLANATLLNPNEDILVRRSCFVAWLAHRRGRRMESQSPEDRVALRRIANWALSVSGTRLALRSFGTGAENVV
jgi:hypothetical protein